MVLYPTPKVVRVLVSTPLVGSTPFTVNPNIVPHPLPTGLLMVLFCNRFTVVGTGTLKLGVGGVLVLPMVYLP